MALSKEEKEQLAALQQKAKEPDAPRGNMTFAIDLSSDTAWERARKLGLVPGDDEPADDDGEEEADDAPKRRGGGSSFFGQ